MADPVTPTEAVTPTFNITRAQIAAFVKDPRTVRDLEAFFRMAREIMPQLVALSQTTADQGVADAAEAETDAQTGITNAAAAQTDATQAISDAAAAQATADSKVEEAPIDGTSYVRKDAGWVAEAAGGGGGLVLLGSQTVSGASSVAFTSLISSTYKMYRLEMYNVSVSTSAASILMQVSTNNGSSYDSGSNYTYAGHQSTQGSFSSASIGASNGSSMKLMNSLRNTAGDVAMAELLMFDPSNTAANKQFLARAGAQVSDGNFYEFVWAGRWQNTAAFNALQIIPSSGTLSGTFRLLGYA